jgi:exopolysaccharide biosynthesis polyprenyl glycosylphosphotransferase
MKKSELVFSFILLPLDYVMIIMAGLAAYHIRFAKFATNLRPAIFNLQISEYLGALFLVGILWIIIFALSGLYVIRNTRKYIKEFYQIIEACSLGLVLLVVLIFFRRELFESRFIILAGYLFSIIFVAVGRGIIRYIQINLYKAGIGTHKIIIIGAGMTADNLVREFSSKKNLGFDVVKRLRDFNIGTENELEEFCKNQNVDEIIQADPNLAKIDVLKIFNFADEHHINFKYAPDILETKVLKTDVAEYAGIPVIEVIKTPLEGWGSIAKRFFDLFFAVFLIIFLSPALIFFGILVKLDSHGPVIYKNIRVGKNGKIFKLNKFRSMLSSYCIYNEKDSQTAIRLEQELIEKQNSKDGPVYKIKDDPRITRVGGFIRRWSIDELPQLLNVLSGNMSLIGPRPHQPREVAKYENHHKKVLSIKPGLTGLAQISGRSDLSFEEEIRLDTYYIENWSLLLDLTILLRTPMAVFKPRKVN